MEGPRVAVVNETLARHVWPNGGTVGRVMTVGPHRVEVVGVVKDLQWVSALQQPDPIAYLNFWQQDRSNSVVAGFADAHQGRRATRPRCCPRSNARSPRSIPTCRSSDAQSLGVSLDYHVRRRARGADDARDVWRPGARR